MNFNPLASYRPHDKQRGFHAAWPRKGSEFVMAVAGTRGGKTYCGVREFWKRLAYEYGTKRRSVLNPLHYWICAPDYKQTKVAQKELFRILGGTSGPLVTSWNKSDRELRLFGGHVLIEFKTTKHSDALVSVGLDGLYYDEAAKGGEESWYDGLYERLSDRDGWAILTTTPKGRNWFYKELAEKAQDEVPGYRMFKWRTVDNIAAPGLAKRVADAKRDMPEAYFMRNYEASFDAFVGQIYEWDESYHIIGGEPPQFAEMRYGVDWGYGMGHPGAILALGRTHDGVWVCVDEVYAEGRFVEWWADEGKALRAKYGDGKFFCPDDKPENIAKFRKAGLSVHVVKRTGKGLLVLDGIETLGKLLHIPTDDDGKRIGAPKLLFHGRCKHSILEVPGYAWDTKSKQEKPVEKNDHACDALRYALHTRPHTPAQW